MQSEKLPEWLPSGWEIEVRERSNGLKDKYYIEPINGNKFRSKIEVFRHLGVDTVLRKTKSCGTTVSPVARDISVNVEKSPEWLPPDWSVQVIKRKCGLRVDKYFIHPS